MDGRPEISRAEFGGKRNQPFGLREEFHFALPDDDRAGLPGFWLEARDTLPSPRFRLLVGGRGHGFPHLGAVGRHVIDDNSHADQKRRCEDGGFSPLAPPANIL